MSVVRNRPEAKWLPSRFRFALFRLFALMRLRNAQRDTEPGRRLVLAIDRDQSMIEHYSMAVWLWLTCSAYVVAAIPLPLPITIPIALVVTPFLMQIPMLILGGLVLPRWTNHVAVQNAWLLSLIAIASAWVATRDSWARPVAWVFFAIVAVNVIASLFAFLLRGKIAAVEREYF